MLLCQIRDGRDPGQPIHESTIAIRVLGVGQVQPRCVTADDLELAHGTELGQVPGDGLAIDRQRHAGGELVSTDAESARILAVR